MSLTQYLNSIEKEVIAGNATEHTHRPALKSLIESLAEKITATNEPQRIKCGAPDYIVTRGQTPVGYIEAKDVGVNLENAEKSEQLKRYRESLSNLILTDYLEFRWYVRPKPTRSNPYPESEHRLTARAASMGKNGKLRLEKDGERQVLDLLNAFLNADVPTVQSAKELAVRMAKLAQLIRDTIQKALAQESDTGSLHQQMSGFREVLIQDLTEEQFADMYAQTICYGLFAARCNAKGSEHFTREHAAYDLPKTNPFLRKMFIHIAGPELDERIAWAVDDLAELLHRANISAILQDFGKRTRREDPVVHFYETFLAAYDPKMREARGVYYTPEPVVSYIVRSIDHILKTDFKLKDGLADSSKITIKSPDGKGKTDIHKVLILDPATGTGTFLYGVINLIFDSFKKNLGMWSGYVSEHLLPRIFGFELLMAPYAVAHMKLGLQLAETGYDFNAEERLRVYLTNTLEEAHEASKLPLFTQWLAEEANAASRIKQEKPVMVVTGNPPYSVSSQNKGDWISELIEDYKTDLNEKKLNLDDDFIKFFRFAQWRIEQTGYGILAFISNNAYLDGLTHRRMRKSLMDTFDDVYLLDLHGNSKKKERSPDGSKDENVFDIQQGVAIGIFVKKHGSRGSVKVKHAELWGLREAKYRRLFNTNVSSTNWNELTDISRNSCLGQFYFFTPKAFDNIDEYCEGWSVKDIFGTLQNGIKTDRDDLFYDYEKDVLENRIKVFYSDEGISQFFRERYRVEDSSSYALLSRRLSTSFDISNLHQCLYRPYDVRYLYYAPGLTSRPAWEVMRHMLAGPNTGLITTRQTSDNWDCLATSVICGHKSCAAYDINSLVPLYIYSAESNADLFDSASNNSRRPNLRSEFISRLGERLGLYFVSDGKGDRIKSFGPEDVFDYMYAVFHSPSYRRRYAEFLKIDFPRLPLTSNVELFRELCALGSELVGLHLMEKHVAEITTYPVTGDDKVENVRYTEPGEAGSDEGRVWINREQYFEGVPPEIWNFHVGGYQVCQKWLKDRKCRQLSYDDQVHYKNIVSALNETFRLMSAIDEAIETHGGWPIN
ncbi:MAG: N-6 DNA methylase [Acidobacteriota bacterium]|nr:N-6 DNA methylase [Acidobacteriota bacterium]